MPLKGDIPAPRSNHVAIAYKKNNEPDNSTMIFIHGGMNESGKLEDSFFLDAPEGKFSAIKTVNAGPHPRANHTAIVVDDKIYMFGGNGGRFFENSVFKDLWVLDVDALTWTELKNECKFFLFFFFVTSFFFVNFCLLFFDFFFAFFFAFLLTFFY